MNSTGILELYKNRFIQYDPIIQGDPINELNGQNNSFHLDVPMSSGAKIQRDYSSYYSDAMDIDYEWMVNVQVMTHTAFLANPPSHYNNLNTSTHTNEICESDWPIQMSRAPHSNDDVNSFPFIQKLAMDQSNTANTMPQAHLDNPGDLSGSEFDFSNASPNSDSADEVTFIGNRRSTARVIEDSDEDMYEEDVSMNHDIDVSFGSNGSTLIDITPDTPPHPPVEPPILYTLRPKGPAAKDAAYLAGVPYQVFKIADEPTNSCLQPAPVFAANGDALHLYFQIASVVAVEASFTEKKRLEYEALIVAAMEKTGMTREQLKNTGPPCSGITLTVGARKYSLACFYGHKRNVVNCPAHTTQAGYQSLCRGCKSHYNSLNLRLRCTFDPAAALAEKAKMLIINRDWSHKVSPDVSFSAVLRILDNGGFFHIKTQADMTLIRTPLSNADQKIYLTRILARSHYGFRTGALLILLTEGGINMVSFDRTDSTKKIDEIGQTIIADSWGFNRLSNVLSEVETDLVLALLLAGDYSDGNAAFDRRNSDVPNPPRLSTVWEATIKAKWDSQQYNSRRTGTTDPDFVRDDIRIWSLLELQRFCRLNANDNGNLVDEVTGCELTPGTFGIDRVVNGIVRGVSGEYENDQIIITHQRLNDFKESGGRTIFKDVETLEMEKSRLNIIEQDHRLSTILILRHYLDPIRTFRSSQSYRDNMARLEEAK